MGVGVGVGVGDGAGALRASSTSMKGLKCMIVFTSKFNSKLANATTTSVACLVYSGEWGEYIQAYDTWMRLSSPRGVRAKSRCASERRESWMDSSDRSNRI